MVWNMTEDEDKPLWITNYSSGLRNCRDEQISGFSRWWVAVAARGAILFEAWQSADWAQRTQTDSDDKKAKLSLQPTLKCGLFNHNLEHPICHKQHFYWTVLLTLRVSWSEQNLRVSLELSSLPLLLSASRASLRSRVWGWRRCDPGESQDNTEWRSAGTPRSDEGLRGPAPWRRTLGPVSWAGAGT